MRHVVRAALVCLLAGSAQSAAVTRAAEVRDDDEAAKAKTKDQKTEEPLKCDDQAKGVKVIDPDLRPPKATKVEKAKGAAKPVPRPQLMLGASPELQAVKTAVESVKIVPFMKALAAGQTVQGVSLKTLEVAWTDKQSSLWVEDEFRSERPADHEWIPSNWMLKVIQRAQSTKDMKWIDLQDQMRSATEEVIFKPSMAENIRKSGSTSYLVLQGHVGALSNATGGPLDKGQAEFHNELRQAFDSSEDMATCIAGAKAVFEKWVWDGSPLPANEPVNPTISYHAGGKVASTPDFLAKQAANYRQIMAMFDGILAAVNSTAD